MKRIGIFLLAAVCCLALFGCGGSSSPAASDTGRDYAQIVHNARGEDFNEAFAIYTPDGKGGYAAIDGYASELDDDGRRAQAEMLFQMLNLRQEDVTDYALSVSLMNTQSYAVAIVRPAEGKTDTVRTALQTYIDGQKQAMEQYLPDQYEIAGAAKVAVTPTGEVVLVCCEDSDTVLASLESALKA